MGSARGRLWALTAVARAGQVAFFTAAKPLGRPPVGAAGWPNRLIIVVYGAWIAAVAWRSKAALTS